MSTREQENLPDAGAAGQRLNLALQGGGALGAFTWGVLDRISDEARLTFPAISGASAGALNAAVFVSGLMNGGRSAARHALEAFWRDVAEAASISRILLAPLVIAGHVETVRKAFSRSTRLIPGQLGNNPLQPILSRHVDLAALAHPDAPRLIVSATHVLSGKPRLFANAELTLDVLLASACIPGLHPTVHIDGDAYWDGGLAANPALFPLFNDSERVLLVRLMRSGAAEVPRDEKAIEAYIRNTLFARPLEEELQRLALAVPRLSERLDEIDATLDTEADMLSQQPTPGLVKVLFQKGYVAADAYVARLLSS
ncbi:patatin-like phospholipase family protein [Stappia sp. F7233]|uniref:Patatin-like phospholipase family protein n=1 Tax=Stappia albiluteola TaxID=2758565 RepID=A0A839ACL5_9HYPH|nr:patatin-like phospholipase family protein [Stappia albiluteola]MBA5776855.1 patatin-like phospholipase family protein [Stappia albiluteola]